MSICIHIQKNYGDVMNPCNPMLKSNDTSIKISTNTLIFTLFFLGVLNTFSHGTYFFIIASFIIIICSKLVFPKSFTPILLFAVFYAIFVAFNEYLGIKHSIKIFAVPLVWLAGYYWKESTSINKIIRVLLVLTFGMALYGILNFIISYANGVDFTKVAGSALTIWGGEKKGAATGQAVNFVFLISALFWALFFQRNFFLKAFFFIFFIFALIYCVLIGSRTFLALTIVSAIITPLIMLLFSRSARTFRTVLYFFGAILVFIILFLLLYKTNTFGVKDLFENSYFYYRFFRNSASSEFITKTGRWDLKRHYISLMPKYLFGGSNIYNNHHLEGGYAHELWLDIYDEAGIIPYLFIVTYTICSILRFISLCKRKDVPANHKTVLLVFLIIVLIQFFLEPILVGQPYFFYSFLLIDGLLAKFLKYKENSI